MPNKFSTCTSVGADVSRYSTSVYAHAPQGDIVAVEQDAFDQEYDAELLSLNIL